jgi:hypothetical protein
LTKSILNQFNITMAVPEIAANWSLNITKESNKNNSKLQKRPLLETLICKILIKENSHLVKKERPLHLLDRLVLMARGVDRFYRRFHPVDNLPKSSLK